MLCQVFPLEPFEELSLLIKAVYRESQRQLTEAFHDLGMTPAQAEVLLVLYHAEPMSLGELGDYLIAEGGYPSRLVDRLVQSGDVDRRSAVDDRRRIELLLTDQGRVRAQQVMAVKQSMLAAARPLIAQYDIAPMKHLLETYLQKSRWAKTVEMRRQLAQKLHQQSE